ncbi:hypothetical protein FE257_003097 [Aspergillus nanangensis]|uniref:Uncharacterized protein n=1 Tax=Aspergillus nanangensis TaxID=2582783 RepID=A0AAD4GPS4_ASPNN|nr:hypothetical protein FE257_003097 [Aspergillus nanangensis]
MPPIITTSKKICQEHLPHLIKTTSHTVSQIYAYSREPGVVCMHEVTDMARFVEELKVPWKQISGS